jgi:hypothetical protein
MSLISVSWNGRRLWKEPASAEHGIRLREGDQPPGKGEHCLIDVHPVA